MSEDKKQVEEKIHKSGLTAPPSSQMSHHYIHEIPETSEEEDNPLEEKNE